MSNKLVHQTLVVAALAASLAACASNVEAPNDPAPAKPAPAAGTNPEVAASEQTQHDTGVATWRVAGVDNGVSTIEGRGANDKVVVTVRVAQEQDHSAKITVSDAHGDQSFVIDDHGVATGAVSADASAVLSHLYNDLNASGVPLDQTAYGCGIGWGIAVAFTCLGAGFSCGSIIYTGGASVAAGAVGACVATGGACVGGVIACS